MTSNVDDLTNIFDQLSVRTERTEDEIWQHIQGVSDDRIHLLRNREVIQWLFGDITFLHKDHHEATKLKRKDAYVKLMKELEDKWGQTVMKERRPDLLLQGQWTTRFGEYICEELAILNGKTPSKPVKKEHFQPDIEVEDAIWEVKTQTHFTTGTAGEKILGCPFKYADLPVLYGKPVNIICLGGAEVVCRENYGNLPGGRNFTPQKQRFLEFFRSCRIEYVAATSMLRCLIR